MEAGAEKIARQAGGADPVPSLGSVASQSSESLVTLREGITAEGSLDFHGSSCGHLVFSGEVSENDIEESLMCLWTA